MRPPTEIAKSVEGSQGVCFGRCGFRTLSGGCRLQNLLRLPSAHWLANRSSFVAVRPTVALRAMVGNLRLNHERRLEAPPGFEPGMEVLQTRLRRLTCCLVLLSGVCQTVLLSRSWASLFPDSSQVDVALGVACRRRYWTPTATNMCAARVHRLQRCLSDSWRSAHLRLDHECPS